MSEPRKIVYQRIGAVRNSWTHISIHLHSISHRILPTIQLDKQRVKRPWHCFGHNWTAFQLWACPSGFLTFIFAPFGLIQLFWENLGGKIGSTFFAAAW